MSDPFVPLTAEEIASLQPAVVKLLREAGRKYPCHDESEFLNQVDDLFTMALSSIQTEELRTLDTAERVCFYEQEFYVLSNFSSFTVDWLGVRFPTSEHAYHWTRFPDGSSERLCILESTSAHNAFRYAQANKAHQLKHWDSVKVDVMRDILRAKVSQHEYVRRKLLETGDRLLVENSWRDPYWGWGPNRDGKNMLGELWMEVRAELTCAVSPQAHTTEISRRISLRVAELPDRTSPDDQPEIMLVTPDELRRIVEDELEQHRSGT